MSEWLNNEKKKDGREKKSIDNTMGSVIEVLDLQK